MDIIKTLKSISKVGVISLMTLVMTFAGLFTAVKSASADNQMAVIHVGANNNNPGAGWTHNVTLNQGDVLDFYAEIHNTVSGTTAHNVRVRDAVTGGNFTDGTSTVYVQTDNAGSASDSFNIHINGGGTLEYIPTSTAVNCHSNPSCTGGTVGDGIMDNGINLGEQNGCNEFIIQVVWMARVVGPVVTPSPSPSVSPSPTPSPTPSPSVSPTPTPTPTPTATPVASPSVSPSPIVINNTNTNTNTNTQTQTVNVGGSVAGVKTPTTTPATGVGVLGMASMFGTAPIGFALSRYGRGRFIGKREDEDLTTIANGLVKNRSKKA